MDKREAMANAHNFAHLVIQNAMDNARLDAIFDNRDLGEQDQTRILDAMDELAQRHFNRWADWKEKNQPKAEG